MERRRCPVKLLLALCSLKERLFERKHMYLEVCNDLFFREDYGVVAEMV